MFSGLTADTIANFKMVLCLSCFAYSDKEFTFLSIDCSFHPQRIPQIVVAALIE
jgi:hypothetical protein